MDQASVLTLVDGEWVSRPLDPYQAMENAQQEDTEMRDTTTRPMIQAPEYGILSQTIISTPLNKLILPANIRHKDLTDIVMVGEDSLHLKEIRDYGHIRHVATKTNFRGRILAAKVFGDPREVPKMEGVALPLPKNYRKHRERRSTTNDDANVLPPEVVVLTLSTRTLMFLWAQNTHTRAPTFSQSSIGLPAGSSPLDRFGAFLAIDPKCRAIAVAAHEGRFILYKTKSMEDWRREDRESSEPTVPIVEERIIPIDGCIMHIDFLSSGSGVDDYHVVLLFVVVLDGRTRFTCFDWDCRQDLSKVTARIERYVVERDDFMPSLLIPFRRTSDFLLVFDTHMSVWSNVLSGAPKRTVVPIDPSILVPLRPGDSKLRPQWTAWDKTPRNPDYPKETFYIAREDGRIMYVTRGPAGSMEVDEAGEWPYRIDTAFSFLTVDNSESSQQYPDVLIAGGASNDGLLCKVGSWPTEYSYAVQYPGTNRFSYVESIPNWTPLTDLSVTQISSPRASGEHRRSAIFVANGHSPYGEISELRHGMQAIVDNDFSGINGCTGIWVVHHGSQMVEIEGTKRRQHYAVFAITLPPETLIVRVVRTQPESHADFSGAWEHGTWDVYQTPTDDDPIEDHLTRDGETISACAWSEEFSIQITRQEARILHRPGLLLADTLAFTNPLLLAATRTKYPFLAVAFRDAGRAYLEIRMFSGSSTFHCTDTFRHELPNDPTCIEILIIGSNPYVFVSTFDSKFFLFRFIYGEISLVTEGSWEDDMPGSSHKICESAVYLTSRERGVLICAMRDGSLLSAQLHVERPDVLCLPWRSTRMGATSANITRSETDVSAAFVSCGSDFCRVRCSTDGSTSLEIDSIWFTDRAHPEYTQAPVSAIYQLPFLPEMDKIGRNLGGFLFAVAGDRLLFSQLDSDVKWPSHDASFPASYDSRIVPRKLTTGAKPTKILYMQKLRRILVSSMEAKEKLAPPHGYRVLHSMIKLLKVRDDKPSDEPDIKQEGGTLAERLVIAQYPLHNAERVYSIVEWPYLNRQGTRYSLIIVGTGIQIGPTKQTGRRLILNTGKSGTKLVLQKESSYKDPVYSIALLDNETTISCIGSTLSIDRFDEGAGRWVQLATGTLPSPGIHISIKSPFVYVSTLQHSHICYRLVDAAHAHSVAFDKEFTDSRHRECTQHLVMDLPCTNDDHHVDKLVLLTDKKSGSVTGLHQPPVPTYSNASSTLFEACLRRTVVRLDRGDIRPPWRRPNTPNGKITGVLTDDIIGACTDGTIFSFSILSQPARYLLRLIQNLIEVKAIRAPKNRHCTINSRSGDILDVLINNAGGNQDGSIRVRDVDPRHLEDISQRGASHKHIDGDLLTRWMEEGEEGAVEFLVWDDTDEEVGKLFENMVLDVDERWGVRNSGHQRSENRELYGFVERWMAEVLMPVL